MEYSIQNNLFTYATSELSQDAILAWTINNINGSDELLKKLGLQLLSKMIGQPIEIERIKVFRQILNIDLLAEFEFDGKQQILIIEDKTGTSEHDNQIQKYIDLIKNECQEPNTGIEKTNAYGEKLPLLKVNKNCVIRVAFVKTHIITDFDELRIRDIQIQNKDVIIQKISLEKLLEIYSEPLFMKHILVQMFTEHLKKIHNLQDETKFKKAFIDWRPENGKNSYLLTTYYGQWLLMKELLPFEETNDHTIIFFDQLLHGNNETTVHHKAGAALVDLYHIGAGVGACGRFQLVEGFFVAALILRIYKNVVLRSVKIVDNRLQHLGCTAAETMPEGQRRFFVRHSCKGNCHHHNHRHQGSKDPFHFCNSSFKSFPETLVLVNREPLVPPFISVLFSNQFLV